MEKIQLRTGQKLMLIIFCLFLFLLIIPSVFANAEVNYNVEKKLDTQPKVRVVVTLKDDNFAATSQSLSSTSAKDATLKTLARVTSVHKSVKPTLPSDEVENTEVLGLF